MDQIILKLKESRDSSPNRVMATPDLKKLNNQNTKQRADGIYCIFVVQNFMALIVMSVNRII
jgi:hypothetical protein